MGLFLSRSPKFPDSEFSTWGGNSLFSVSTAQFQDCCTCVVPSRPVIQRVGSRLEQIPNELKSP